MKRRLIIFCPGMPEAISIIRGLGAADILEGREHVFMTDGVLEPSVFRQLKACSSEFTRLVEIVAPGHRKISAEAIRQSYEQLELPDAVEWIRTDPYRDIG